MAYAVLTPSHLILSSGCNMTEDEKDQGVSAPVKT
jgi:hypothetical protein